mmetsp:Transcript_18491/g.45376  ORF Transcript_18491/g.45376 Transcript_18491/m.45376 type:complete len:151 (+) Transcript_18491:703-1155(+)
MTFGDLVSVVGVEPLGGEEPLAVVRDDSLSEVVCENLLTTDPRLDDPRRGGAAVTPSSMDSLLGTVMTVSSTDCRLLDATEALLPVLGGVARLSVTDPLLAVLVGCVTSVTEPLLAVRGGVTSVTDPLLAVRGGVISVTDPLLAVRGGVV